MFLLLLAVTYHSVFELGIIPDGSSAIFNEEFWGSEPEPVYVPITEFNVDKESIVYYSIFEVELRQRKFTVGGNIKTYAQKSRNRSFSPYRTRFLFKLGYNITEEIKVGFNHSCTHAFIDLTETGLFQGSYEELYIRFEK